VIRSKLTVDRDRRAILHVEAKADLPTPTHGKPQSDPIRQSPVHGNEYLEGMRKAPSSTTDEDKVFTREDRYCSRETGENNGING
jgi:hypothetical protein